MAGRASLAFLGQEDIALSSDPQITYFKEKFEGSSHYASRVDKVHFNSDALVFGTESYIVLPRSGDLITEMYLKIQMPSGILVGSVEESVGTQLITYVELYIGNELIERIWGEYLALKWDVEIPEGKQGALTSLIGKATIVPATNYTIPLPFSLLKKGLPICAFKEQVTFRIVTNPSSTFTTPPVTVTDPVSAFLHVEYTYLSELETNYIKANPQLHLVEQVQRIEFFCPVGATSVKAPLDFSNIVKELFFVIQNDTALGYDYLADASAGTEQLQSLELFFNSTERISTDVGTPLFLRVIQGLEFHTRVPVYKFYVYSFSLDPESDTPTGGVNLSRIQNQILKINLNPSAANRYIRVYAVNYNFLEVANGSATILFSNFH
jgi:hypothetical protein